MDKIQKCESVVLSFDSAIYGISWSLHLSGLIINKAINLSDFSHLTLTDKFPFLPAVKWNNSSEYAQIMPLAVTVFYISACEEGYFDLFEGKVMEKDIDFDLHSAQMILRILRNSLSHPYISVDQMVKICWNVENPKYKKVFVVAEIGMALDATNLDQKEFKLSDLGGWSKFLDLLKYLKSNLQKQLQG